MLIKIENKNYQIEPNEFPTINHPEYNNLILYKDLGELERLSGFINEIQLEFNLKNLYFFSNSHGGYLPINSSNSFDKIYVISWENRHWDNLKTNINAFNIDNIFLQDNCGIIDNNSLVIDFDNIVTEDMLINNPLIISSKKLKGDYLNYKLWETNYFLNLSSVFIKDFLEKFHYFIKEDIINYDNLINLCIMVKNAGPQFKNMLINNLLYIDQWTILDTGSTDETIEIIKEVLVGKKKGILYEEPFINFKDSRNRLLDLAGTKCKYTIMLDDTYCLKNDLRSFLKEVRSDQFADSFTLFIRSDDTEYGSNRILKSDRNLRYINKIHEVITDKNNVNVVVPIDQSYILDERFDYMEKRTMERKYLDLKLLYEELEEDPNNSRTHYYLAQTYNLLEDYENCFKWFKARVEHPNPGFIQEKYDAAFEMARCANFKLNKPWEECEKYYLQAYELDKSRPESLYFIGIHYYLENNLEVAYKNFKEAFRIGYPIHCQYSLKPTLSYHFLPKFLAKICYTLNDFKLGEQATTLFLEHNNQNADSYEEMISWHNIYQNLNIFNGTISTKELDKPIFCFIIDGGWKPWNGSSINKEGVGGSETWAIEIARGVAKSGKYRVYVFCRCNEEEIFEGVQFYNIEKMYNFINSYKVEHCIISRYSEYIPVVYKSNCKNVYLILHDLGPTGIVIPIEPKLKKVFCLTEWHCKYFLERFSSLQDRTQPLYYGIDHSKFNGLKQRKKYNFIYSSTANRGLLPLLQIWPKLYKKQPKISLDIYCDLDNKWVNNVAKDQVNEIKRLLVQYSNLNIKYHGWVNKQTLANGWKKADIWFYPCIFQETFCLTALEAAINKTLVISNGLAALENTVGERGVLIEGNPMEGEWQERAIEIVEEYLEDTNEKLRLIEENYRWANSLSWEGQANRLIEIVSINEGELDNGKMGNWLDDLPNGSKPVFEAIINYFNNKGNKYNRILEIGVFAGISLIELVRRIDNSIGVGIDQWKNYEEKIQIDNNLIINELSENMEEDKIEEICRKNIIKAGLGERISLRKGNSTDKLIEMIKNNEKYNFIYVDASHLCLDTYSDIVLAWEILEIGGILAIDDYLFNRGRILDSPYEAVNYFLKKNEGKYKILNIGYRVFIEKTN
jgi:hypothetical protein